MSDSVTCRLRQIVYSGEQDRAVLWYMLPEAALLLDERIVSGAPNSIKLRFDKTEPFTLYPLDMNPSVPRPDFLKSEFEDLYRQKVKINREAGQFIYNGDKIPQITEAMKKHDTLLIRTDARNDYRFKLSGFTAAYNHCLELLSAR